MSSSHAIMELLELECISEIACSNFLLSGWNLSWLLTTQANSSFSITIRS